MLTEEQILEMENNLEAQAKQARMAYYLTSNEACLVALGDQIEAFHEQLEEEDQKSAWKNEED